MRRIDRSKTQAPAKLTAAAVNALKKIEAIIAAPAEPASKDFDGAVYASEEVKQTLWDMQHRKCCFCEHAYERKWSTVEHFRPKTKASRDRKSTTSVRGYWWLAYEFENLYFCCSNCNTPKSDYFPLDPASPPLAVKTLASNGAELPIILDPGVDDPEQHLTFTTLPNGAYRIAPLNASPRGTETIFATRLDRDDLNELREKHLVAHLQPVVDLHVEATKLKAPPVLIGQIVQMARDLCEASREFSLLAKAFFKAEGLL